jgi:predicted nucleic acid-binding protein
VVLDADVVIGALDGDDAHHSDARQRFTAWEAEGTPRLLSLVSLAEVLVAPARDPVRLRAAREAIAALGISVHLPSEAVAVDAARLRDDLPISLPAAFALATARHVRGTLVTFDRRLVAAAQREGVA